jgi:integrase
MSHGTSASEPSGNYNGLVQSGLAAALPPLIAVAAIAVKLRRITGRTLQPDWATSRLPRPAIRGVTDNDGHARWASLREMRGLWPGPSPLYGGVVVGEAYDPRVDRGPFSAASKASWGHGGKRHEMPAHHKLEQFLDEYLDAAGIREDGKAPLFRSALGRTGILTDRPMHRIDAYQMVRRRTAEAGLKGKLGCHVFRATGITAYLEAGGTLENAQAMAAHESPRTTKLYDRTGDEITLDEVERIQI